MARADEIREIVIDEEPVPAKYMIDCAHSVSRILRDLDIFQNIGRTENPKLGQLDLLVNILKQWGICDEKRGKNYNAKLDQLIALLPHKPRDVRSYMGENIDAWNQFSPLIFLEQERLERHVLGE